MPRVNINSLLRARPRPCTYGAPMGARNRRDADPRAKLYCQRVRLVDGDYAPDGTYWGGGRGTVPLYAVFSEDLETLCFYRAWDYMRAKAMHRRESNENV